MKVVVAMIATIALAAAWVIAFRYDGRMTDGSLRAIVVLFAIFVAAFIGFCLLS